MEIPVAVKAAKYLMLLSALSLQFSCKQNGSVKMENKLRNEKSPYLLQHAKNPVHWYPWGEEAFNRAKKENKLILLSIGYSTCHWCHVMEKESFEKEDVAAILNKYYVSIKVDREERPDVDNLYMGLAQALGVGGGWPLNLFLTPDQVPFTGGTYFPPEDAYGKRSFKYVLQTVAKMWESEPQKILDTEKGVLKYINQKNEVTPTAVNIEALHQKAILEKASMYEPAYGGFSSAPKFPMGHALSYLILLEKRNPDKVLLNRITHTLDNMASAGLYDQIGGGFHRYSTDREWLVPHFEKMLYDQALLITAYANAYSNTLNSRYAEIVAETIEYLRRDMLDEKGGFYSAEDADSEGEEGTFYLWEISELKELVPENIGMLMDWFDIKEHGNFEGKNILTRKHTIRWLAEKYGKDEDGLKAKIKEMNSRLLAARSQRIRPHLDDKILTDWNGLVISALSKAAQALPDSLGDIYKKENSLNMAKNAAEFVLKELRDKDNRLLKSYRQGPSNIAGFIEDYAFFANGLLDLYESSFEVKYLEEAVATARQMIENFWDSKDGGFYFIPKDGSMLLKNAKELNDGAIPSGNSVAAQVCARLYRITANEEYKNILEKMISFFGPQINTYPSSYPVFLSALDMYYNPGPEIILSGNKENESFKKIWSLVKKYPSINQILIHVPEHSESAIFEIAPFTKQQRVVEGDVTFYYCQNRTCQRPLNSPVDVEEFLKSVAG